MMISAIGSDMIATSMTAEMRLAKLRPDRKTGDTVDPIQRSAMSTAASSTSQRASARTRPRPLAFIVDAVAVADRWNRRRRTASTATAMRMTTPYRAWSQNCDRRSRINALEMKPRNRAPSAAPTTVPDPPKILTPPTTTAATTWSVTPVAAVALIVPKRMPHMTPAMPDRSPHTENTTNVTSPVRMPRIPAASGLLPTA